MQQTTKKKCNRQIMGGKICFEFFSPKEKGDQMFDSFGCRRFCTSDISNEHDL